MQPLLNVCPVSNNKSRNCGENLKNSGKVKETKVCVQSHVLHQRYKESPTDTCSPVEEFFHPRQRFIAMGIVNNLKSGTYRICSTQPAFYASFVLAFSELPSSHPENHTDVTEYISGFQRSRCSTENSLPAPSAAVKPKQTPNNFDIVPFVNPSTIEAPVSTSIYYVVQFPSPDKHNERVTTDKLCNPLLLSWISNTVFLVLF